MAGRRKSSEDVSDLVPPPSKTPASAGTTGRVASPPPSKRAPSTGTTYSIVSSREEDGEPRASRRPRPTSGVYASTPDKAGTADTERAPKSKQPLARDENDPASKPSIEKSARRSSSSGKHRPPPPPVSQPAPSVESKPPVQQRPSIPSRTPLSRPPEVRVPPPPPSHTGPVSPRPRTSAPPVTSRALMVTDDGLIRETLARVLKACNVEAIHSTSPNEAKRVLGHMGADKPTVLVFVDAMMKGIDGPELIATLRAHPRAERARIVLVSALSGAALAAMSAAWGADGSLATSRGLLHIEMTVTRWLSDTFSPGRSGR